MSLMIVLVAPDRLAVVGGTVLGSVMTVYAALATTGPSGSVATADIGKVAVKVWLALGVNVTGAAEIVVAPDCSDTVTEVAFDAVPLTRRSPLRTLVALMLPGVVAVIAYLAAAGHPGIGPPATPTS